MSESLKVAIAGLGTVGIGTVRILQVHAQDITSKCGRPIEITAVSALDKGKDRGVNIDRYQWFDDAVEMAKSTDAEVLVELIGGASGVALDVTNAAIAAGRHVVTANKALIAEQGNLLAQLAEDAGLVLAYEAAVAGGIPVVKALREGLAGDKISRVIGILNGTCNYILSTMENTGRDFNQVLHEAQDLGYAESDPSFDVDGIDSAHKLAILASLAFGTRLGFDQVHVEGIRDINPLDFLYAKELGYRIKLLGLAGKTQSGVYQRVYPCLIDQEGPLAAVDGSFNAVIAESDFVGRSVYEGRGAGPGPTATAVVADLIDIATNRLLPTFGIPAQQLTELCPIHINEYSGSFYVRLTVNDQPGVFADISAAFGQAGISMESILQRDHDAAGNVHIVIITHSIAGNDLLEALQALEDHDAVRQPPNVIRIEDVWGE